MGAPLCATPISRHNRIWLVTERTLGRSVFICCAGSWHTHCPIRGLPVVRPWETQTGQHGTAKAGGKRSYCTPPNVHHGGGGWLGRCSPDTPRLDAAPDGARHRVASGDDLCSGCPSTRREYRRPPTNPARKRRILASARLAE